MDKITEDNQKPPAHKGLFVKGVSGNKKGRPKGKKNKRNELLDEFMTKVVALGGDRFIQEFMKLEGKAYTEAYLTAYEFVRGKIARTELSSAPGESTEAKQFFLIEGVKITL